MIVSVVPNYLVYESSDVLVLPVNAKSSWSDAYNYPAMLACGGMFHFKAIDLFRRHPNVNVAIVKPLSENVSDVRNLMFVRSESKTSSFVTTMQRALSKARRSGLNTVIVPLLHFNPRVKYSELKLDAWTEDCAAIIAQCVSIRRYQVEKLAIVTNNDSILCTRLRGALSVALDQEV